jgi:DNA polymerase-3 subunit beta
MVLRSRAPEQGEAEITTPVPYSGASIEIGFNPLFLVDVLKALEPGNVLIELKESNRPGLVRSGADFLYVIMPVSLA